VIIFGEEEEEGVLDGGVALVIVGDLFSVAVQDLFEIIDREVLLIAIGVFVEGKEIPVSFDLWIGSNESRLTIQHIGISIGEEGEGRRGERSRETEIERKILGPIESREQVSNPKIFL
jgi:hypothetical protein